MPRRRRVPIPHRRLSPSASPEVNGTEPAGEQICLLGASINIMCLCCKPLPCHSSDLVCGGIAAMVCT